VKTPTPIQFLTHREVVPLEAHSHTAYAAVQMPPTLTDGTPERALGENRFDGDFGRVVHLDPGHCRWAWHGDNLPICGNPANAFSFTA